MSKVVGVATTDGTLCEMAFENVTAAESLTTKRALVRSFSGVWNLVSNASRDPWPMLLTPQKMSLQMLQVKVGFVAV